MVTQIEKKSKKASSKNIVKVIARYLIKANGYICYLVRSSNEQDTYCTTLNAEGKATGCTCPSRKPCKHETQMEALEAQRQVRVVEPAPEVQFSLTMTEAEMEAWGKQERRLWDEEMATWTDEQIPAPAPIEQEMPTPVVTIDQAMAEAQQAMEGYDSCTLCGCRVKTGQSYCARC